MNAENTKQEKAASTAPEVKEQGKSRKIGELLVSEGLVTELQVDEALALQKKEGGKVVENLIALDHLDPKAFIGFLSKQPGIASIDLLNYTIPQETIDLVPADFALKHEILPIDQMGRFLTVAMACPLDARTIEQLEEMAGYRVRPMLASGRDIWAALKRYYPVKEEAKQEFGDILTDLPVAHEVIEEDPLGKVESALTFEGLSHLIRKIESLPALPETVVAVKEAMSQPDVGTAEMAHIVGRDPAIAAKVIGLANSAAYSFNRRVDSIELAAALLGLREVYALVLGTVVLDYFKVSKTFDYKAFWRRSTFCATTAKIIAKVCNRTDAGALYAAGLLHDLGRAVLAQIATEKYAQIDHNAPDDILLQQENDAFGIAHPEVGYLLATAWELPTDITEPIRFHHAVEHATEFPELAAITALSARLAHAAGSITRDDIPAFMNANHELVDQLNLDEIHLTSTFDVASAMLNAEASDE